MPHWISSKISTRAVLVGELAGGGEELRRSSGWIPPSPWIGSSRMQPVAGPTAAASASRSFGATNVAPGESGSNGARLAGWPVTESAPSVRPWKPPSSATTPGLPVALRAYFSADSFASAPELQKNEAAPPKRAESRSASVSIGSVQ